MRKKVILLVEKSRAVGRRILDGVVRYARTHDQWEFYQQPQFYRQPTTSKSNWLKNIKADGVIAYILDTDTFNKTINYSIPAVIFGIKEPILHPYTTDADNAAVGEMAAQYFLDKGFTNFAFCGFSDMYWSVERFNAFARHINIAGFIVREHQRPAAKFLRSSKPGRKKTINWLKALPKPTALLACNDDCAVDVVEACKSANIDIPDEIAILGVDNDELACELQTPSISSIFMDFKTAGYKAAELLDKMMAGKKIKKTAITISPLYVVTRRSTDILAIDEPIVARAVAFIHKNTGNILQVSDIVSEVGISRRALELRFKKTLGRTVQQEIRRIRVNKAARMLLETNLSISNIALKLGYSDTSNISRYFKREKGLEPSVYRKQFANIL